MSTTHKPVVRRCVSCTHLKDRTGMLRLVRLADGEIGLDRVWPLGLCVPFPPLPARRTATKTDPEKSAYPQSSRY